MSSPIDVKLELLKNWRIAAEERKAEYTKQLNKQMNIKREKEAWFAKRMKDIVAVVSRHHSRVNDVTEQIMKIDEEIKQLTKEKNESETQKI